MPVVKTATITGFRIRLATPKDGRRERRSFVLTREGRDISPVLTIAFPAVEGWITDMEVETAETDALAWREIDPPRESGPIMCMIDWRLGY